MTWNYRLVHRVTKSANGPVESYGIHEVFYDKANKPFMVTDGEVGVIGDTPEEAKKAYDMMAEAFKQPILEFDKIGRRRAK